MYDPFDALTWGRVALIVWYVPSSRSSRDWQLGQKNTERRTYRVNFDYSPESILGEA
jgi:hypothetical protein